MGTQCRGSRINNYDAIKEFLILLCKSAVRCSFLASLCPVAHEPSRSPKLEYHICSRNNDKWMKTIGNERICRASISTLETHRAGMLECDASDISELQTSRITNRAESRPSMCRQISEAGVIARSRLGGCVNPLCTGRMHRASDLSPQFRRLREDRHHSKL